MECSRKKRKAEESELLKIMIPPRKRSNSGSSSSSLSRSPTKSPHTGLSPCMRGLKVIGSTPPVISLGENVDSVALEKSSTPSKRMSPRSIVIRGGGSSARRVVTQYDVHEDSMFEKWKDAVDRTLLSVGSPRSSDIRDALWRDMFDQGASIEGAIKVATRNLPAIDQKKASIELTA